MEKYEFVKNLGSGSFGVARLMRNKETNKLVTMKSILRGPKIKERVVREIVNHRSLRHPNVVRFKEVLVTPTEIGIVMEYAAGGNLSSFIRRAGRLSEDEARFFFQQFISGVGYCHSMQICHRDLKPENILLDGIPFRRLKICDFGLSKSALLHSRPNSLVGTPAFLAPEVLSGHEYDGEMADVWSCGATLYVMLVGGYPFRDPDDPKNTRKTYERILSADYTIPEHVYISQECKTLLSMILVVDPSKRMTISEIRKHPWFLKNLPKELKEEAHAAYHQNDDASLQSVEEIMALLKEDGKEKVPPPLLPSPSPLSSSSARGGSSSTTSRSGSTSAGAWPPSAGSLSSACPASLDSATTKPAAAHLDELILPLSFAAAYIKSQYVA